MKNNNDDIEFLLFLQNLKNIYSHHRRNICYTNHTLEDFWKQNI